MGHQEKNVYDQNDEDIPPPAYAPPLASSSSSSRPVQQRDEPQWSSTSKPRPSNTNQRSPSSEYLSPQNTLSPRPDATERYFPQENQRSRSAEPASFSNGPVRSPGSDISNDNNKGKDSNFFKGFATNYVQYRDVKKGRPAGGLITGLMRMAVEPQDQVYQGRPGYGGGYGGRARDDSDMYSGGRFDDPRMGGMGGGVPNHGADCQCSRCMPPGGYGYGGGYGHRMGRRERRDMRRDRRW
ncbi:hypothetical protein MMC25_002938 [Agyrium rufum]|nr:hypothetical protein [Agyrium rufum]